MTAIMMVLRCASYVGLAVAGSAIWGLTACIAARNMTSVLGGIQNTVSNCGGFLGPIVTGYIIGATGSFMYALMVSGAACLIGALVYLFMLKDIKPIMPTNS